MVGQTRSCEETASKQEVVTLTPTVASAGLCGIPVLLQRHKHASWVIFQVLPLTAVLTQHLDLALKMTGSSFTVRICTFFLPHLHGLCWSITPIYEVIRHKYIHKKDNHIRKRGSRKVNRIYSPQPSGRIIINQRHRLLKKKRQQLDRLPQLRRVRDSNRVKTIVETTANPLCFSRASRPDAQTCAAF